MRLLLLFLASCLSWGLAAHNPLTAKFELNAATPGLAVLHVYVSQTGLHQALLKHYPDTDFTTISVPAYKQLAVTYLKEHVLLWTDEAALTLGEGGIKLGDHQSDFKFLVAGYPPQTQTIRAHIDAFAENDHHQSVLWWKHPSGSEKIVLTELNEYTGTLSLSTGASSTTQLATIPTLGWLAFGLGGIVLGSLLLVGVPRYLSSGPMRK